MSESNPFATPPEGEAPPANPFAAPLEPQPEAPMVIEEQKAAPVPTPPVKTVSLTDEQRAVLDEHGITPSADGVINIADHVKLLTTLSNLRQQVRTPKGTTVAEGDVVDPDQIRQETRREVEAEMRLDVTRAQVVAAAASAGFADQEDAPRMLALAELDSADKVKEAVSSLAEEKRYLLAKRVAPLEQGVQVSGQKEAPGDWIRQIVAGSGA
jgi:hypothetical protein